MNNNKEPISGKKLYGKFGLENFLIRKYDMLRLGSCPSRTVINNWKKGVRIVVQPVVIWKRTRILVASQERLTYIPEHTLIPFVRYHLDVTKLDPEVIKIGQKRGRK